ncbi:hypothetical protein [Capnocytophaga canis]|uniref:hypothetical protein n=1 Tax=Capnocytophaga canis TaxID=1848903 RepID=UPI001562665C|nr:hypothetical protein [Capnocytophaga canis]
MSQELEPIRLEVAMEVDGTISQADQLDVSMKKLDVSTEKTKKKFEQQTQKLIENGRQMNANTQAVKKYAETVQEQIQATQRQNESLTKSTQKFNSLGNSVNQITRELPAFTYSAQTGFMAIANNIPILTDAMAKLRAENEALKASGQKTTPVWKQLIGSLFSWNSLLSVGITLLTVYGDDIGSFIMSLFKGKESIDQAKMSIESLNKALNSTEYQKAKSDILSLRAEFDLAKKGIVAKEYALKQYNKTLGEVMGTTKDFAQAEDNLIKKGDAYIKMMFYKSAANAILQDEEANNKIIEAEKRKIELTREWEKAIQDVKDEVARKQEATTSLNGLNFDGKGAGQQVEMVKKRVGELTGSYRLLGAYWQTAQDKFKELQKVSEELDAETNQLDESRTQVYKRLTEKYHGIAGMFDLNLLGDDTKKGSKKIQDEYKKLLERIAELDKEYSKQSFDKHDMEVQALKDKFAKVREAVKEYNKKNKLKIGLGKLDALEDKAVATLKYRHETENLKKELSKQKELFEEYEAYKTKVGKQEADERFKHDLNGIESYRKALEEAIAKTNADPDSPQRTERLRELQAMLLLANEEQSKRDRNKFADLLEEYKGFNQKRITLETQYNNDVTLLEQQRNEANNDAVDEAIKVRKAKYEEDLANLQATILQSSDFYQKLFSDLSKKGYKTLKDFSKDVVKTLQSAQTYNTTEGKTMVRIEYDQINEQGEIVKRVSNITVAEFERIKAKAEELNNVLRDKNPFAEVVADFSQVVEKAKSGDLDELSTALNGLNTSVKGSISTFKEWGESLSTIFGDGVGQAVDDIANLAGGVFDLGSGIARIASGDIVGGITSSLSGIATIYKQVTGWREKAREQQVKMMIADIEALRLIQKQNLALKENVRELSVYNDNLELRNRLIREGVISQDGIQNKFKYDLQMLKEYTDNLQKEQDNKAKLWENVGNSWFDTGKIKTGSASSRQFSAMIGANFEDTKRRMKQASELFGNEARDAYNMLNEAGSMENYVKMLDQRGWLKGEAKEFYEQWKKSGESVTELEKKFADLKNEMRQVVMGENFDGFVNNFANALAQAQGNVAQFAEFTHDKIKSSLFNAFKYQYLREQLKPLYEQMGDLLNEGVDALDKDKIEAISQQFESAFKSANAKLEQLGQQFGTNLYDNKGAEASPNSLKGAVRGITEQQADLLAGQFGGLRLAQLETNKINKQGFAETMAQTSKMIGIQLEIQHNTRRTADNTEAMKDYLKSIDTSVKSNKNDLKGNGIKP